MRSEIPRFRRRDVIEVAQDQHGLVTVEDLQGLGLSSATTSEWRALDRLVRLAPRVYLVPELLDDQSHLAAACLARPQAVASHRAAARLWGFDGIDVDLVEITVPGPVRQRTEVVHRSADLRQFEVVEREGIRCTDPTRTLIDLGAVVAEGVVERSLESALRWRLTTLARLRWRMGQLARPGRPGPPVLRRVLERRPPGAPPTDSDLETLFLQCLRAAGVRPPVRQHRVQLPDGSWILLDDAYLDELVFMELDGWATHGTRQAFRRDRRRQNQAVILGWMPLRFTWADVVHEPERVAAEVKAVLHHRRSATLPS
jgi:very-short-patch-repair endonuclease